MAINFSMMHKLNRDFIETWEVTSVITKKNQTFQHSHTVSSFLSCVIFFNIRTSMLYNYKYFCINKALILQYINMVNDENAIIIMNTSYIGYFDKICLNTNYFNLRQFTLPVPCFMASSLSVAMSSDTNRI